MSADRRERCGGAYGRAPVGRDGGAGGPGGLAAARRRGTAQSGPAPLTDQPPPPHPGRLPGADRPDPVGAVRGGRRPAPAGAASPAWCASNDPPRCWPGRWTATPRWPLCTAGCGRRWPRTARPRPSVPSTTQSLSPHITLGRTRRAGAFADRRIPELLPSPPPRGRSGHPAQLRHRGRHRGSAAAPPLSGPPGSRQLGDTPAREAPAMSFRWPRGLPVEGSAPCARSLLHVPDARRRHAGAGRPGRGRGERLRARRLHKP
ncbi:hypothetical protein STENM223S_09169 [Streptomyces tendae]